jgi:hypothetical protein
LCALKPEPDLKNSLAMAHSPELEANTFVDLTTHEEGDIGLWIRQQKQYHNVPNFVSNELSRCTEALPSVTALFPPASLPMMQVLDFAIPKTKDPLQDCKVRTCHGPRNRSHGCLPVQPEPGVTLSQCIRCAHHLHVARLCSAANLSHAAFATLPSSLTASHRLRLLPDIPARVPCHPSLPTTILDQDCWPTPSACHLETH